MSLFFLFSKNNDNVHGFREFLGNILIRISSTMSYNQSSRIFADLLKGPNPNSTNLKPNLYKSIITQDNNLFKFIWLYSFQKKKNLDVIFSAEFESTFDILDVFCSWGRIYRRLQLASLLFDYSSIIGHGWFPFCRQHHLGNIQIIYTDSRVWWGFSWDSHEMNSATPTM